jgi:hypothetical protein
MRLFKGVCQVEECVRYSVSNTIPYRNCIYNRLPEDEPSGSKHVEDIKIKIKILN